MTTITIDPYLIVDLSVQFFFFWYIFREWYYEDFLFSPYHRSPIGKYETVAKATLFPMEESVLYAICFCFLMQNLFHTVCFSPILHAHILCVIWKRIPCLPPLLQVNFNQVGNNCNADDVIHYLSTTHK